MIRPYRACRGRDRGQATTEYVGLLSIVAVTVASIVAVLLAFGSGALTHRVRSAACAVLALNCVQDSATNTPASSATSPPTGTGDPATAHGTGTNGATADGATVEIVEDDSCHGWRACAWSGIKQVGSGGYNIGKGAVDDVTGVYDLVRHPSGVVDAGKYIVEHPGDAAAELVWDTESSQMWDGGDYGGSVGRTAWNVGSWFIPYYDIGKGVSKVGKIGKIGKTAEEAEKAAKSSKAAEAAEGTGSAARKEDGSDLDETVRACANSFAAGTGVLLADGAVRRIDQIAVGETVLATDPSTGRSSARTVTAVLVHDDVDLTDLTVRDINGTTSIIRTTPGHPFFNGSWTAAGDLSPGDRLASVAGHTAEVLSVHSFRGPATRYNLTVAGVHTFYVQAGQTPVLVHNDNGTGEPVVDSQRLRNTVSRLFKGVGNTPRSVTGPLWRQPTPRSRAGSSSRTRTT